MELKNTFLKANWAKVLMNGKGPFFHWFLRVEFLSALPFSLIQCPVSIGGGSVLAALAAAANPDSWQVLLLPALAAVTLLLQWDTDLSQTFSPQKTHGVLWGLPWESPGHYLAVGHPSQ